MSIDLLNLQPTVVSRDLRGKICFIYGEPKSGKTSNAVKFPSPILVATEKGYNALSGVFAQPVNKWSEFKQVLKQLKKEEVQNKFETVIIDTVDNLISMLEEFICQREDVDKISDVPYGGGYKMVEKELDAALRSIPLMDYGLVMISHSQEKEFTDENGTSFNKITSTLPNQGRKVVSRMADIIGFSKGVKDDEGTKTYLFLRGTPRFEAGSRFKYTPDYIEFTYNNLVNAIADAIEKGEKEDGATVIDEHINVYQPVTEENFDGVTEEISNIINQLMESNESNASKIQKIIEEHLGKGKKLADATDNQLDMCVLIRDDLKELV